MFALDIQTEGVLGWTLLESFQFISVYFYAKIRMKYEMREVSK